MSELNPILAGGPLVRAMVQIASPAASERIYDPTAGAANFLAESFEYIKASAGPVASRPEASLKNSFCGKEKRSFAHILAVTEMMLTGIEFPEVVRANPLGQDLTKIQERDCFDVIFANLPVKSKGRKALQEKFPVPSTKPAYLYLQHVMALLKTGGRAAVIIGAAFLTAADAATVSLRRLLLESCHLHTILECPPGVLSGREEKFAVLFFEKGRPTSHIWFYRLAAEREVSPINPLTDSDFTEFLELQREYLDSDHSWSVDMDSINHYTCDLSPRHPRERKEAEHRSPQEIMEEISALDAENTKVLSHILQLL